MERNEHPFMQRPKSPHWEQRGAELPMERDPVNGQKLMISAPTTVRQAISCEKLVQVLRLLVKSRSRVSSESQLSQNPIWPRRALWPVFFAKIPQTSVGSCFQQTLQEKPSLHLSFFQKGTLEVQQEGCGLQDWKLGSNCSFVSYLMIGEKNGISFFWVSSSSSVR